jgi:hypothetical protein
MWRMLYCSFDLIADPRYAGRQTAGVRCVQLSADNRCMLFGRPERLAVCVSLRPTAEMCGTTNEEAFIFLTTLEHATQPG